MTRIRTHHVFNLTFLIICLISSCSSVNLEPYGPPIDADLHCHTCASGNVLPAGQAITYFGEVYTEMFVSSNGIISLGCDSEDELSFERVPMIAPYLSDIDTRLINNAAVDGTVFYRTEVGDDTEFDVWVLDHFGIPFQTSYEVIATYDHVKEINQTSSSRNTFQVVVYVSAYGDTAVCFNYPANGLNWPDASNPPMSIYPIAGFYSGADLNIAYYLPGSGTADVSNLDDLQGNFGVLGQFCYIVSGLEVIGDCTIDALYCRPPSFFPINTPIDHTDVLSSYSLCSYENLSIDTSSFSCSQLGDLIPVTATIGPLSCVSYFIPVVVNNLVYINCPSDIHVYSNVATTVTWIPPTLTGDCPSGHSYSNYQPDYSLFPIGTTQVTYHAYDINYHSVYCTFDVTVEAHVIVTYHVIDIMNRPLSGAAIGGPPDCEYTDTYGLCETISPTLLVGDFIPAGYYYVNFNGNIYAIPHGDISINCLNLDIILILSPPGFYRSVSGDIIGCSPGTYSTSYEASECFPCSSGTYNDDYYQTSCEYCPLGYYAASGATECFTCYSGYYLDQYSGSCELCPAGTYSCDRAILCEDCPWGSWSVAGSSECSYCSSGYYLDQYSNLCTICPANTYSSDRATECTQCPEGYYAAPGSSSCSACNAGYYLDLVNYQCLACPTGYFSCERALECSLCAPGGFSAPGSSSCSFCNAGYYRNADDTSCSAPPCGCSPCPAGTYSCDRADVCEACPAGSWSMAGSSSCYSCTAGYYLDTQTGSCLTCPANTYSADRAILCTICPEGSYSEGGATACTFCQGGYFYNNNTGSCELCPANTYSSIRATECTPCPIGGYSFEGSIECSFCSAGYYLDPYADICQPCAAGTYSCDRAISCEVCGEGSYSYAGSSSCSYCTAGYYFDQYAQQCLFCAAGTFSADRASSCTPCPVGYYSQPGSATCYSCTAGYYLNSDTGECTACPLGFTSSDRAIVCYPLPVNNGSNEVIVCVAGFYLEAATNSCLPCPPNTFSADAASQCTPCPYGSSSPMASSSCSFCSAGYYLDVSLYSCFPCPANYFSPDRATECYPCPFNAYSSVGSAYCSPCPNDTFLNSFGACELCPSNSFFYEGVCVPCDFSFSASSCPYCPPGYESDLVCNECLPGYYSVDGTTCVPCPSDGYSGPGASSCVYCPPGDMWDNQRYGCYPCDT